VTALSDQPRPTAGRDPLVAALARYVEALHRRYPGGPDQLRRERLDGRAKVSGMTRLDRDPAA
jgi:hypothetical protein